MLFFLTRLFLVIVNFCALPLSQAFSDPRSTSEMEVFAKHRQLFLKKKCFRYLTGFWLPL